ncbi:MAG: hypothetical protein AAF449_10475, partial [Myxococcota bacterium]
MKPIIVGLLVALPTVARAELPLERWLAKPTVRMVVLRAAGAEFEWRDFVVPAGLLLKVLDDCEQTDDKKVLCDPDRRWRRSLDLSPGRAVAWTWRGQRTVTNGSLEDVHAAIGRHLGPLPRVWLNTDRPGQHRALSRALEATGRWRVTHRLRDIESLRRVDPDRMTAACDASAPPPKLGLLRVRGSAAVWFDPEGKCRAVRATASDPRALADQLTAAWRVSPQTGRPQTSGPRSASTWTSPISSTSRSPSTGRLMDRHLREMIRKSHAALDAIPASVTDPALIAVVRKWIGVRYQRDGTSAAGIDDFNLLRQIFREAYGMELKGEPVDWLQDQAKVPIDEKRPEATARVGDILFKVPLSYRPRGVLLYLGGG